MIKNLLSYTISIRKGFLKRNHNTAGLQGDLDKAFLLKRNLRRREEENTPYFIFFLSFFILNLLSRAKTFYKLKAAVKLW